MRANSGWKWDDETGADINPSTKGAWDDYVAVHPRAAPFRNKGWVHLAIFDVLGGAPPKGLHVFCASQATSSSDSSQQITRHSDSSQLETSVESSQAGPGLGDREYSPPWGPIEDEPGSDLEVEPRINETASEEKEQSDDGNEAKKFDFLIIAQVGFES